MASRPDSAGDRPKRADDHEYVVIARRYRPQTFADLVGQQHVATGLANAITSQRVGHAYLFTGARGVGKTSTARILAKALNCVHGPTAEPCGGCDICRSIVAGDDVDVLEIDGASNRGIDEIRQLRSNVNVRPSRARFKIYIIDEVHMLTAPAFNALLKTLEEPPEHVKFIFCTTDPEKVPITVQSRCQRFDFSPVESRTIAERLRHVVEQEGLEAEDEALNMLARRAAGSMRDSQSLLEQLLAFCDQRIRVADVHQMLGTAASGRLHQLGERIMARDAAGALAELDRAVVEGVDLGQLAEQLLGYFRDMMAASVGCGSELLLHVDEQSLEPLREAGQKLGLETILAIVQILDHTLARLRSSTQVRTLIEVALVRICGLEDLAQLSQLIGQLQQGQPLTAATPASTASSAAIADAGKPVAAAAAPAPATTQKKTPQADENAVGSTRSLSKEGPWSLAFAQGVWQQAISTIGDMTGDFAGYAESIATSAPNTLVVRFAAEYTHQKEFCERPERKARIEQTLSRLAGRDVRVTFELLPGKRQPEPAATPRRSPRQRMRDKEKDPFVQQAIDLFDAEVIRVDEPPRPAAPADGEAAG